MAPVPRPSAVCKQLHRAALQALVGIQSRIPLGLPPEQDPLPAGVHALCRKLEPNLAALLKDLCVAGREVQGMLGREPGVELMAVLDVVEPPTMSSNDTR